MLFPNFAEFVSIQSWPLHYLDLFRGKGFGDPKHRKVDVCQVTVKDNTVVLSNLLSESQESGLLVPALAGNHPRVGVRVSTTNCKYRTWGYTFHTVAIKGTIQLFSTLQFP